MEPKSEQLVSINLIVDINSWYENNNEIYNLHKFKLFFSSSSSGNMTSNSTSSNTSYTFDVTQIYNKLTDDLKTQSYYLIGKQKFCKNENFLLISVSGSYPNPDCGDFI